MRTFERVGAGFVGRELDGGCLTLPEKLIDIQGVQLESMIMVECSDDQTNVFTPLDSNHARVEFVFLGRDFDFVDHRLRPGPD
jgi:hypothetical protein